jgi:hypothetical protein
VSKTSDPYCLHIKRYLSIANRHASFVSFLVAGSSLVSANYLLKDDNIPLNVLPSFIT